MEDLEDGVAILFLHQIVDFCTCTCTTCTVLEPHFFLPALSILHYLSTLDSGNDARYVAVAKVAECIKHQLIKSITQVQQKQYIYHPCVYGVYNLAFLVAIQKFDVFFFFFCGEK